VHPGRMLQGPDDEEEVRVKQLVSLKTGCYSNYAPMSFNTEK
jgi:hypothetical protein